MRICLGILAFTVAFQATETDNPPIPKDKWTAYYADKTWGIKVKTVRCTVNRQNNEYHVVLEFAKDLKPEEVKAVKDGFEPTYPPKGSLESWKTKLEFHFFDQDGVVAYRSNDFQIQGEITGVTGDAFRAVITLKGQLQFLDRPEQAAKISKVELRLPSS